MTITRSAPNPVTVGVTAFVNSGRNKVLNSTVTALNMMLPTFVVVLVVDTLLGGFVGCRNIGTFLGNIRPYIVTLVLSATFAVLLSTLFNFSRVNSTITFGVANVVILPLVVVTTRLFGRFGGGGPSPVLLVIVSTILNVVLKPVFT